MSKKIIKTAVVTTIFTLLIASFSNSIYASNDQQLNNPSEKRDFTLIRGSIDEIKRITEENNQNEIPSNPFLNLQGDELEKYKEKNKVKKDAPIIKKIIEENPKEFADFYYDSNDGTIVVQVTQDEEKTKSKIKEK
ncbi:hypothetical protein [Paenibacillus sp. N3.4]|uniref:hypothetical protein n=1 Tax=Paenibacillus sp. N3.4 TaxID=2603222 RepID=UPI0011CC75AC|nr:hypothetical protein [Paenibacillus sp. N3.4]TXK85559.1 hypothetical protein FU659_03120 [Paenibacillus sp. N3.4]